MLAGVAVDAHEVELGADDTAAVAHDPTSLMMVLSHSPAPNAWPALIPPPVPVPPAPNSLAASSAPITPIASPSLITPIAPPAPIAPMASPALVTPIAPPAPGPAALITPIASQAPITLPAPVPAAAIRPPAPKTPPAPGWLVEHLSSSDRAGLFPYTGWFSSRRAAAAAASSTFVPGPAKFAAPKAPGPAAPSIDGMDQAKFAAPKNPGPAAPSTPIHEKFARELSTTLARELILKYQIQALPEPPGNSGGSAASGSATIGGSHLPSTPPESFAPPNNCATADDYPGSLRPLISM